MSKAKSKAKPTKKKPAKKRVKRSYRDHERIAAISLCEQIGPDAASKKLNVPIATVRAWAQGWRNASALQMYHEGRGVLADVYEKAAWESLSLARERIDAAPYRDLMRGAALATDKMNVLRGKPSQINANANTNANVDPLAVLIEYATDAELPAILAALERANHAKPVVPGAGVASQEGANESGGIHARVLVGAESRP